MKLSPKMDKSKPEQQDASFVRADLKLLRTSHISAPTPPSFRDPGKIGSAPKNTLGGGLV